MYEDASIESEAFAPGSRVFSIASAGCTAIELAQTREVTAVDINPVQLEYARSRAEGGPARTGSAERVMTVGRRVLSMGGWSRGVLEQFAGLDNIAEQMVFWRTRLDTRAFRVLLGAMLCGGGLRSVYASPLHAVLPPQFDRVMRGRMERCWRTHPNRSNPFVRKLLFGATPERIAGPIRHMIRFVCADAAEYLESCAPRSFDGFTISNITDGAPPDYRVRLFAAVRRTGAPGAVLVQRSFREPADGQEENAAARDRSFIWGIVRVTPVAAMAGETA
jgi:SAM-dependent methyltransferase